MGYKDDSIFARPNDPEFKERLSLVEMLVPIVNRRLPNSIDDIDDYLYDVWIQAISKFQVDQESRYAHWDIETAMENQNPWEDDIEEIRRAKNHVETWIEDARIFFNELIKNIYIRTATDKDQSKHFPNVNWDEKAIIDISNQRAILSKDISIDHLDKMLCDIISQDIEDFNNSVHREYLYQTKLITGFSKGLPCTNLLFKVSYSGMIAHSFPVNEHEVHLFKKRMTLIVSSMY